MNWWPLRLQADLFGTTVHQEMDAPSLFVLMLGRTFLSAWEPVQEHIK